MKYTITHLLVDVPWLTDKVLHPRTKLMYLGLRGTSKLSWASVTIKIHKRPTLS
jgi:hypothetical protein